jgi:hypothetical protein
MAKSQLNSSSNCLDNRDGEEKKDEMEKQRTQQMD